MSPVKRLEGEKSFVSTVICEGIANNCNELKTTQLLKDEDENQPHSPIIKETKTPPLQISPNSNFTSSDQDKIFPSHYDLDSIEKSEKDATETAASLAQIHLSSEIKREEIDAGELPESLNDGKNQLTSTVFQTSKTSEIQEPSCPPVTSSDQDKIFPSHYELDSIEKSEKDATETAASSVQIHLSSEIKREEIDVGELPESLNDGKNQLTSTVFQTLKTSEIQEPSCPPVTSSDQDKIFPSHYELDSMEKSEKDATETAASSVQIHLSSEIKREEIDVGELPESLNDGKNQLTSTVFQASKTSEIQEPSCPPVTSSNKDEIIFPFHYELDTIKKCKKNGKKIEHSSVQIYPSAAIKEEETSVSPSNDNEIFSSHHELYSIEKEEEIDIETADSSVRKLLSSVIKRVEISIAEPRTNLNYVENQLHYLDFQISKTSPTTSSSIVMPFKEDKILSSDLVIDFIENSEKNDSENTVSSTQKRLSSTINKKKKRVCKSRRNLNNVENQPPSVVFQLSKSSPMQTTVSSTVTATNEGQKISFQRKTRSTQNLQKNVMKTVSSSVQTPLCSRIKSVKNVVGDFGKSLELLELKNKSNSSQVKTDRKAKKRATKRKSFVNSASPSPNCKKIASSIIQDPNVLHPSAMKLKSIVLIPAPRKSDTSFVVDDGIYPRFANVDPSKVLSSLNRQRNITKSLACGKAISLFFPGGFTSQEKTPEQYNLSSNQKPTPLYKFKKAKFNQLHLSKKYPVLDSFTMDKCYGKLFSSPKLLK